MILGALESYDAIFYDPKLFGAVGVAPAPGGAPGSTPPPNFVKKCPNLGQFGPKFHFQLQMDTSFDENETFG